MLHLVSRESLGSGPGGVIVAAKIVLQFCVGTADITRVCEG